MPFPQTYLPLGINNHSDHQAFRILASRKLPTLLKTLHPDFYQTKEQLYDKYHLSISNLAPEAENEEYGACDFTLKGKQIKFRVAKLTPTKPGLFVTIWKRNKEGITTPFDFSDDIDYIVISVREEEYFGQFVFPTAVLRDKQILSHKGREGKRGIRVYPPWCKDLNKQATKTQQWQIQYFLPINDELNFTKVTQIYSL